MSRIRWYGPTLVTLVTVLLVLLIGPSMMQQLEKHRIGAQIALVRGSNVSNLSLAELSNAFRNVATIVKPSVVHLQIEGKVTPTLHRRDLERFHEWFFDRRLPNPQEDEDMADDRDDRYNPFIPMGTGSGWVFDDQGHIVTNNHVVANDKGEVAQKIVVTFSNKSKRVAEVIGRDPQTDIAVLKVEGNDIHPAVLAAEPVKQGELVFAFGSPFGFEFSMSQGIVSAKGRTLGILKRKHGYENFIQTDAAINRGNSGGPLTNIYGEVVGMNTAIATPGNPLASFSGMGFAIPASMIHDVVSDLIEEGKVVRGYLGIGILPLDEKKAYTYGFKGEGVLVEAPQPGFPAEQAGILAGDIITKVGGKPVSSVEELQNTIAAYEPDTTVDLEVFRGKSPNEPGETLTMPVKLVAKPDALDLTASDGYREYGDESENLESEAIDYLAKLGLERITTSREELTAREHVPGVVVLTVRRNSVAQAVGIRRGDVITQIFGVAVENRNELIEELSRYDLTKPVRIRVHTVRESGGRVEQLERSVYLELPDDDDAFSDP